MSVKAYDLVQFQKIDFSSRPSNHYTTKGEVFTHPSYFHHFDSPLTTFWSFMVINYNLQPPTFKFFYPLTTINTPWWCEHHSNFHWISNIYHTYYIVYPYHIDTNLSSQGGEITLKDQHPNSCPFEELFLAI